MSRQQTLDTIRGAQDVSVLVIGGGINGIGVFYDLAHQGVDVLLVEKSDFCAGTSAASTRIIHGGLRYLENSEFRLVSEALEERNRLLQNAPHYVKPLPITIPIFSWKNGLIHGIGQFLRIETKPGDRGAILLKLGLTLYDVLAGMGRAMPTHRFHRRDKALALRPALTPRIVCTATYYDAQINYPERLCLELILDAEKVCPTARAVNYVSVVGAEGDTVKLYDELAGETLEVRPKLVVNASGAWIDFTNHALRRETKLIGGTKGSHLVLDCPELWEATKGDMLYFANADGRICIFYPFYDKIIAGSTDIPVDDPETAVCDEDEVDYLLESLHEVFPAIQVNRSHIVFRFCGVRPLPRMDALTPGQISRDHSCAVNPPGNGIAFPIFSLVGGKWTTYRAFAEQVTDRILLSLGRQRSVKTDRLAIGGGKHYPRSANDREAWLQAMNSSTGLAAERLAALLDRYGSRAEEIADYIAGGDDSPLRNAPGFSRREIGFIAECERILHLDDLVLRRTLLGLLGQVNRVLLEELASILTPSLGWSEAKANEEVERTSHLIEAKHGTKVS